jgi:CBS domain-containing protein
MTTSTLTVKPDASIHDVAKLFYTDHVGAVPVVDETGRVVGIVSEGDLIGHAKLAGERHLSWWQSFMAGPTGLAHHYAKAHGVTASDVMTSKVIAIEETTPIAEAARLLEEHRIKSLPVVRDGKLVGVVRRTDLVRMLATAEDREQPAVEDRIIDQRLRDELATQPWANMMTKNIVVQDGVVHVFGVVLSDEERHAVDVAARNVAGVKAVRDHCAMTYLGQYGF